MDAHALEFARTYAQQSHDREMALLRELATIPAPSGKEDRRAAFVASWLRGVGCTHVHIDEAKNVICQLGDADAAELDVFSAHTDVVFDDVTPLPLREGEGRMLAPGIGDDTACLVGLLMATEYLVRHPQLLEDRARGVLVVANSCEEGLGNLRGTRALYEQYGDRIRSHVAFDSYLGIVATSAVGSHRWQVACTCEGGHSWGNFGRPNAIVELARLIERLAAIEVPTEARTTWNVGTIQGGSTVNSIAERAEMLYEYRSTSEKCLSWMKEEFLAAVEAARREGVTFEVTCVGERPGDGDVDARELAAMEARLCDAVRAISGEDPICQPLSTDANIPLSRGVSAACVGAVRGGGAHTRAEWIDPTSLVDGLALTLLIMLGA